MNEMNESRNHSIFSFIEDKMSKVKLHLSYVGIKLQGASI